MNPRPLIDPVIRFWPKVHPEPNTGCWIWDSGHDENGYGLLWIGDGVSVRSHRFAYEVLVGPIPAGLTLDHLCRNKWCVNPAHLEPCTSGENAARSPNAPYNRRARQTECLRGHPFTEANTYRHHGRRECRACNALRAREKRAA